MADLLHDLHSTIAAVTLSIAQQPALRVDALLPFPGYRPLCHTERTLHQRPELYPTLEHFYQSERFRGTDEALRCRVATTPSAHEARKLALSNQSRERSDWLDVHERVMLSGIWMLLREHRGLARQLKRLDLDALPAYPFRDMYWGNDRPGISKDRFGALLRSVQSKLGQQTVRVLATGSRALSNEFLVSSKLDSLFSKTRPDVVLIGSDSGTDELVERWAVSRQLPVRHIPYRGKRTTSEMQRHHRALVNGSTHVVVFDQGDANSQLYCDLAKRAGRPNRIIKVSDTGALAAQATSLPPAASGRTRPHR